MTAGEAAHRTGRPVLIPVSAAIAAVAGVAALAGWVLGLPVLAQAFPTYLPMAPSTALLLAAYGGIAAASASVSGKPWADRFRPGCAWAGLLISLTLLALSLQNVYLDIERLGLRIPGPPGDIPVGHMSPASALCLSFAGLALALLPKDRRTKPLAARWSLGLAGALIATTAVMLLAYLFGAPVLYSGPFIPPAATTAVALLALGIALAGLAWPSVDDRLPSRGGGALLVGFLALSVAVIAAGLFSYQHYERRYRAAVERELASVAELKVAELVEWRGERTGDAALLSDNLAFSALVRRFLESPGDVDARGRLLGWLEGYGRLGHYERISLLDAAGVERLAALRPETPADLHLAGDVRKAMGAGAVSFIDFHRHAGERGPRLGIAAPIFDDRNRARSIGAVVLTIDPTVFLYPFIARWPSPSQTAETLLVRREAEEVVFLTDLRFLPDAALKLRLPLDSSRTPAAAAARGTVGIVEGPDYRGVPVLADVRPVPDSPWFLVTRMDIAEIYAPLRERLWLTVALTAALLFGVGVGSEVLWRRHAMGLYRERLAAERERSWLQTVIERSQNEVYVFDAATLRFTFVNRGACENLGYTLDELLQMTPLDIKPMLDAETFARLLAPLRSAETPVVAFESRHRRRDGTEYPVEVHLQQVDSGRGLVFLAVVNDVTERSRAEAELRERNAELERFIYTVSHDLKSPVVTIKSFLGYLEQDLARQDSARTARDLEHLRNAAARMGALLDDLLEMSRVGRVIAAPVTVTFEELASEAAALVAGAIAARGVQVRVAPADLTLRGDRARLLEIWQNLVENAVKFMGNQPAPLVQIGAERRNGGVEFYVKDNGIGLDPRYRERIFGLFERLDPGVEGTGLGLALVKRIVELYGGAIRAESAGPGRGTTFVFTLPGALATPRADGVAP